MINGGEMQGVGPDIPTNWTTCVLFVSVALLNFATDVRPSVPSLVCKSPTRLPSTMKSPHNAVPDDTKAVSSNHPDTGSTGGVTHWIVGAVAVGVAVTQAELPVSWLCVFTART